MIFQSYDGSDGNPMPTLSEAIIQVFLMSLGGFGGIWGALEDTNHSFIGKLNIFIFLAVVYILLLNLLIAMMGDTYAFVAEIKNEWMRQWARTVLIVERGIPPKERLRQQDLYAERMATGEKALVLKQTMSVSKQATIDSPIQRISHNFSPTYYLYIFNCLLHFQLYCLHFHLHCLHFQLYVYIFNCLFIISVVFLHFQLYVYTFSCMFTISAVGIFTISAVYPTDFFLKLTRDIFIFSLNN